MADRAPEAPPPKSAGNSPDKLGHVFNRALTISSSHPLGHKDKKISGEKRARFEALDLEVLLQEFKNVAIETEQQKGETPDDDPADDAAVASSPGFEELQWLKGAGLSKLADMHSSGIVITPEALAQATRGFMPVQMTPVKRRVETLNRLIEGGPSMAAANAAESKTRTPQMAPVASTSRADVTRIASLTENGDTERLTSFNDLGAEDQSQLQYLNIVLLTSMYEHAGISHKLGKKYKKIKDKKGSESKTFGVNLETLVTRDLLKDKSLKVPLIFTRIVDFLTKKGIGEEGIFRKAGSAARVKALRQRCEDLQGKVDFEEEKARPHDVASLFKQFLRETPEPLLSSAYLEAFYLTQNLENTEQQEAALQMLSMLLPPVHRECMDMLLKFLALVAANDDKNKMGIANLAVVFAPSLFYVRGHKGQKMLKEVEMQVSTASTLRLLLERHLILWDVPKSVMGQLRFVRENQKGGRRTSNAKEVKKVVGKKLKKSGGKTSTGAMRDTEKIQWVSESAETPKVKAFVHLKLADGTTLKSAVTELTTAGTLMKLAIGKNPAYGDSMLTEQGGNIGYRKLHPSVKIFDLFKRNNDATLVVEKQQA